MALVDLTTLEQEMRAMRMQLAETNRLLNEVTMLLTMHTIESQPTPERQLEVKEKLMVAIDLLQSQR